MERGSYYGASKTLAEKAAYEFVSEEMPGYQPYPNPNLSPNPNPNPNLSPNPNASPNPRSPQ